MSGGKGMFSSCLVFEYEYVDFFKLFLYSIEHLFKILILSKHNDNCNTSRLKEGIDNQLLLDFYL